MRIIIATAIAATMLAGCGTGKASTPTSPTSTPSSSPAAASPATAAIGTTQRRPSPDGITVAVTVYHVRSVKSRADFGEPSRRFIGIDVRVCVTAATGGPVSISQQPWTVDYADDTQAEPITEWWDGEFSVPLYPAERKVAVGRCVRGWIMFRPLKGRATTVSYAPGSGEPAFWRIP
jgi:hypothetical protein